MSNAVNSHRWFPGLRTAKPASHTEPADLGTAFGLEVCFDELPPQQRSRGAKPRPGWLRRLFGGQAVRTA